VDISKSIFRIRRKREDLKSGCEIHLIGRRPFCGTTTLRTEIKMLGRLTCSEFAITSKLDHCEIIASFEGIFRRASISNCTS